jgi:putative transposase
MRSGFITCSASAREVLNSFWPRGASLFPRRPFGVGARNSARALPGARAAVGHDPETSGTWTRCSSVAHGRGVHPDPERATLSLARRGSGWRRARHPRSAAAGWQNRQTLLRRPLKGLQYVPRVIVTDKLRSYGVAQSQLLPKVEHRRSRYLNNRAQNSHRPTRRCERRMQRFKSPEQAQDFLSDHSFIHGHVHPHRHLLTASSYREIRTETFSIWQQEICTQQVSWSMQHIRLYLQAGRQKLT